MLLKIVLAVGVVGQLAIMLPTVWGERKYAIKMVSVEFDPSCQNFFESSTMELTKYNETTPVISGNTTLKKEILPEYYVAIEGYQQSGNDENAYESSPSLEAGDHICNFLESDKVLMIPVSRVSNAPQKCPAPLGDYWIDNFIIDNDELPDDRPGREKWRFEATMLSSNESDALVLAKAIAYVEFPNLKDDSERRS